MRSDAAVAFLFLLLGAWLWWSAGAFPPGVGTLPGPGLFPRVIGALMALLALALLAQVRSPAEEERPPGELRRLAVPLTLLGAYLALWPSLPFLLSTGLFLTIFLRWLGERWITALVVAAAVSISAVAAFQYGLRVSLP